MRVRMGQFEDLSDYLAFKGFSYEQPIDRNDFTARIERRNNADTMFKTAFALAQPRRYSDNSQLYKNDEELICEDLWAIIRHELWKADKNPDKSKVCNDAYRPLVLGNESDGFIVVEK